MMNKSELIKNTKKELNKALAFIIEHKSALLDYHDLKLHNAFYYDFSTDYPLCHNNEIETGESIYFYRFCDSQYDLFKEDLKQCFNIDFEKSIKHLGHTSSFYLWSKYENTPIDLLNTLLNEYFYNGASVCYNAKNALEFDTDFYTSADIISDLQDIANGDFYEYLQDETRDTITIYETLKGFKDNQIEDFKEFLQWVENDLQDEINAENEKIKADKKHACDIATFYHIPHETMNDLKACIYAY